MGGGQATARRPRPMAMTMATAGAMARRSGAETASDLVTREIVIGPGGSTGWHYHLVPLMAVVGSGTLTRILSDGTVEVHHAGDSFVEPPGIHHVHLGRNLGAEPVVLHVTAAIAEGAPFALPAEAPPAAGALPAAEAPLSVGAPLSAGALAHASDEAAYLPADPVEAA